MSEVKTGKEKNTDSGIEGCSFGSLSQTHNQKLYRYMEALSASMGVCGSVGAGLGASANVPSINFCSGSLPTFTTPCICRKRKKQRSEKEKAIRVTETERETGTDRRRGEEQGGE